MAGFKLISENDEFTIAAKYEKPVINKSYETESELEKRFINKLVSLEYEYRDDIKEESDLIKNLKVQIENLNNVKFKDNEWNDFLTNVLCVSDDKKNSIKDKTRLIQEETNVHYKCSSFDKNLIIIDKKDISNNKLQVINQYREDRGKYKNRYDVTILINGLPLVHIELKKKDVKIREAFNQIDRYLDESFHVSYKLFDFIQIFIISNGVHTKYYANTTRYNSVQDKVTNKNQSKSRNSFEFTSYFADRNNKNVLDLMVFADAFLNKRTLLNMITKYSIFTSNEELLVMRPYQIVATEKILNKIIKAHNYKEYGTINAGGFIWHTTGSGKTLTSFKTARACTNLPFIDKVLFVVDRKDLDYQTQKEYDKFEKDSANSNTSTEKLRKQLNNKDNKIIITTIQKLSRLIENKKNLDNEIFKKEVVIIFDECHRSHFGKMHNDIIKTFKKYYIFGFTGTPIINFEKDLFLKTTAETFGGEIDEKGNKTLPLHTYTIVDAINDNNVLKFKVSFINSIKSKDKKENKRIKIPKADERQALSDPRRIREITHYILENFDIQTKRHSESYVHKITSNVEEAVKNRHKKDSKDVIVSKSLRGFNSILCVSSIDDAKAYYLEFKKQNAELIPDKRIKVATIYSYFANEESKEGFLDEENLEGTSGLDKSSREFLDDALKDYNKMFKTSYDTSSEKFQNYYKDVSQRMKNREIDLLIVVNMFLTGFDATTLNTLWVDKNLKYHGLIQAFSRTNRILNSIKSYGNIVCFRNLEKETDEAISVFANKDACKVVLLRTYKEYLNGFSEDGAHFKGYIESIKELQERFECGEEIIGEKNKKDFVKLIGHILKLNNILTSFEEFEDEKEKLEDGVFQTYLGMYNDIYIDKREKQEKDSIADDLEFEMELVKQIEINIDYILSLIEKYNKEHNLNSKNKIREDIYSAIRSSIELRYKEDLINEFINKVNISKDITRDWVNFFNEKKEEELNQIIKEENLNEKETKDFISNAYLEGELSFLGGVINKIIKTGKGLFSKGTLENKGRISKILKDYFNKYKED